MRVLIVEDDSLWSEMLRASLLTEFPDAAIDWIGTESEFHHGFDALATSCPDVAILDVMLAWARPAASIEEMPEEVKKGGYYKAGIRCAKMLANDPRTRRCHVVIHSVLSREDIFDEVTALGRNTLFLSKAANHHKLLQVIRFLSRMPADLSQASRKVFIVHGRDGATSEMVARFIERLGHSPVLLGAVPSMGSRSRMEKLERNSDVSFALVLLTADDFGGSDPGRLVERASQSVILELGYFLGKLGRKNVCALRTEPLVDLPPEYDGIGLIQIDAAGAWKLSLASELRSAGLACDVRSLW